jgi:hypothetical protein
MGQHYRCYFLNDAKKIASAANVVCESDAEAMRTAAGLLADANRYHGIKYHGIEVWTGTRRVCVQTAPGGALLDEGESPATMPERPSAIA